MSKLILKRKERKAYADGQMVIRVNEEAYNAILDVAYETGMNVKSIASKMIIFALENVEYQDNE